MATEAVVKPEVKKLETAIETLRSEVKLIKVVNTAGEYERLGQVLVGLNNYIKDVHSTLDPFVEIPRRAYEAARQERQKWLNAAEELKGLASVPMADFKRRERLAAEAEQNRINEERRKEAERQAEEQRKAAEALAEADRKAKAKEIEAARKSGDIGKREADKMKKQAEEEAERAKIVAAEEAKRQADNVQEVTVQPSVPKISGLRGRVNWKFRIVDVNKIPRSYMIPDEKSIGYFVRETKKEGEVIPGVEAYSEDSI